MRGSRQWALFAVFVWLCGVVAGCTESPDSSGRGVPSEHPGVKLEPMGPAVTAEGVKEAIRAYVATRAGQEGGHYALKDPVLGKTWRLEMDKIHDPVRTFEKDGKRIYFACSDFRSLDGPEILDVDFWLTPVGNGLKVAEVRIHKVDGKERYTYEGLHTVEVQ
jgi:hypothetical protein